MAWVLAAVAVGWVLECMKSLSLKTQAEVVDMVSAAASLAFGSIIPVAVLFSQKLIGAKVFVKEQEQ